MKLEDIEVGKSYRTPYSFGYPLKILLKVNQQIIAKYDHREECFIIKPKFDSMFIEELVEVKPKILVGVWIIKHGSCGGYSQSRSGSKEVILQVYRNVCKDYPSGSVTPIQYMEFNPDEFVPCDKAGQS